MPRPCRFTSGRWRYWRRPWGPNTRMWPQASTTWLCSTAPRVSMPRPNPSSSGRWRLMRKPWGPTTLRWPQASATWRRSTRPRAGMPGPSPSIKERWRFMKGPWGQSIPTWPRAGRIWHSSTVPGVSTMRRGDCSPVQRGRPLAPSHQSKRRGGRRYTIRLERYINKGSTEKPSLSPKRPWRSLSKHLVLIIFTSPQA